MKKPLKKKILSLIGITVVGIIIGISVSSYLMLRLSLPVSDTTLKLDGVISEVEITIDTMGIAQIWAENESDAYFGLGYQHAADRLFQMDLTRRLAQGRLSEMVGEATFEIDKEQRRIGHLRMAESSLDKLSADNKLRLEAYVKGINSYIYTCRSLPFEYRLLPVGCERWSVVDCLALYSFQSWFSNSLMNRDEFYYELAEKVGNEKAASLVLPYPDWAPATVKKDSYSKVEEPGGIFPEYSYNPVRVNYEAESSPLQDKIIDLLFGENGFPFLLAHSSNAWVVSPEKSESGFAMLASDPHLELTRLPQFWYPVGLHIKDSSGALGITTPGLPFVVMGHNGKSGWAFTAGGTDVTEYFVLKTNPDNENEYLVGGEYLPFELVEDSVSSFGTDNKVGITYKLTPYGPVIDEFPERNEAVVLFWAGYKTDLDEAVSGAFHLMDINSFEDFQETVTNLGALDVNMMYADVKGDIGYQLSAPLINHDFLDNFIYDASVPGAGIDFHPFEKTPHVLNPSRGWIASCNNLPERSDYVRGHYFIDRILSIEHLLSGEEKLSVDDMKSFQMDLTDRYLVRFREDFASVLDNIGEDDLATRIRVWDGLCDSSSLEAAVLFAYLNRLKKYTFEDELGSLYSQVPARWIELSGSDGLALWYDDINTVEELETFEEISSKAMTEAVELNGGRCLGDLVTIQMEHPLSVVPLVGDLLDLSTGRESHSGSPGTLNASFNRMSGDGSFESLAGPSWRFVIDFGDVDNATMVIPAGNSGNPMSGHFMDFYPLWKSGERWTVPFGYEKVKERAESILILAPAGSD